MNASSPDTNKESMAAQTTRPGFWKRFWFAVKIAEVRLRFVAVLLISAGLIGYWDVVQNYYEKYTRRGTSALVVSDSKSEYFCPMHTFIVRDHFDKCPICGMDLVKRGKGEKEDLPAGTVARVQVSPQRVAEGGVKTELISKRVLSRELRVVGQIEAMETAQSTIANRFPGRVEKLLVNYVGAQVKKGDPVAQIYSPEYIAAAMEYVIALKSADVAGVNLANAARERLLLSGFTSEQVAEIARSKQVPRVITYYTPIAGTVLDKKIVEGQYLEQGAELLSVADLGRVWVQANVLEADLAHVKVGQAVDVRTIAYPGVMFIGNVSFIYPTVDPLSRSVKVRIEINNPGQKLRPGMYTTAEIRAPIGGFEPLEPPDLSHRSAEAVATSGQGASGAQTSATVYAARGSGAISLVQPDHEPEWEEGYTCVMHPEAFQERPGVCTLCDCGMNMTKWRRQKVLAVPENSVIDTGTRKFVYMEQAKGVYDARQVEVGARVGDWYPLLAGLKAGMEVAGEGSFLIDAENRLNPSSTINVSDETKAPAATEPTIIVKGGFEPEVLRLAAGQPRRIVFDRRDEGTCTNKVLIPSLGIEQELKPYAKTVIDLPTTATGEIDYSCGMHMLHGKIVTASEAP
ncbi:MAG: efflux RND transporter periplasmic adaptor subunit [Candidatus Sumerlaeaceae bacterium]